MHRPEELRRSRSEPQLPFLDRKRWRVVLSRVENAKLKNTTVHGALAKVRTAGSITSDESCPTPHCSDVIADCTEVIARDVPSSLLPFALTTSDVSVTVSAGIPDNSIGISSLYQLIFVCRSRPWGWQCSVADRRPPMGTATVSEGSTTKARLCGNADTAIARLNKHTYVHK